MPSSLKIRAAVPDDAAGIVAVLTVVVAERIHSAIERVWTVEQERRYMESFSPLEVIHLAVDETGAIAGLQILERWAPMLTSMAHVGQIGTSSFRRGGAAVSVVNCGTLRFRSLVPPGTGNSSFKYGARIRRPRRSIGV